MADGDTITIQLDISIVGYGEAEDVLTLTQTPDVDVLLANRWAHLYSGPLPPVTPPITLTTGPQILSLAQQEQVYANLGLDAWGNRTDVGYDVIALLLQSNMVSHGTGQFDTTYIEPPDPRIKQWPGSGAFFGRMITALDPLFHHEQRLSTVGHGLQFARNYVRTIPANRGVLLVPCAHSQTGGNTSSLASPPTNPATGVAYQHADGGGWDTTGAQGGINLYEYAISQITNALARAGAVPANNRFVGVLSLGGEADAGGLTPTQWAAYFDLLLAGIRSRIPGAATSWAMNGQFLPERIAVSTDLANLWTQGVLTTPVRNTRHAVYYAPVGYGNTTDPGELHFNNDGQLLLGDSAFKALPLAIANVLGTPPVPPTAVTLAQSGTSLIATVNPSAGRVTDYLVKYQVNSGAWTTLTHTATIDITFTVTGLTLGDAVNVEIATINEQGTSAYTTASLTLVHLPNAPTLGTPTHTATSISPVWTPAGTGSPATSFLVEAGVHPAGGVYTSSVTVPGSATTGQLLGLFADKSYDYRVTPINGAGSGTAVTGTVSTDPINALLTDVAVSAFRALSFARKLNTAYAGNCLKVRRSSDNTTQNIGFDGNGDMDVAALLAFCGAGDGYVDTWYDQSGNTRDMAQALAGNQPKIVTSGAVLMRNGRPAATFDGSTQWLDSSVPGLYAAGAATILATCELDSSATAANNLLAEGNSGGAQPQLYTLTRCPTGGAIGGQIIPDVGSSGTVTLANGSIAINTSATVQFSRVDTGTQDATWVSGVQAKALTNYTRPGTSVTLNKARIGGLVKSVGSASMWQGAASEIVTFPVALTDPQRVAGETNQKSYYAIA